MANWCVAHFLFEERWFLRLFLFFFEKNNRSSVASCFSETHSDSETVASDGRSSTLSDRGYTSDSELIEPHSPESTEAGIQVWPNVLRLGADRLLRMRHPEPLFAAFQLRSLLVDRFGPENFYGTLEKLVAYLEMSILCVSLYFACSFCRGFRWRGWRAVASSALVSLLIANNDTQPGLCNDSDRSRKTVWFW